MKNSESKLIGKTAEVTDRSSWFYKYWGTIIDVTDGEFTLAICGGKDTCPLFERDQIRIKRK